MKGHKHWATLKKSSTNNANNDYQNPQSNQVPASNRSSSLVYFSSILASSSLFNFDFHTRSKSTDLVIMKKLPSRAKSGVPSRASSASKKFENTEPMTPTLRTLLMSLGRSQRRREIPARDPAPPITTRLSLRNVAVNPKYQQRLETHQRISFQSTSRSQLAYQHHGPRVHYVL